MYEEEKQLIKEDKSKIDGSLVEKKIVKKRKKCKKQPFYGLTTIFEMENLKEKLDSIELNV